MSDPSTSQRRPLKVLILGGGIAGLPLANALQNAPVDIEYLILEARDSLAPQLWAGLALVPNGCRILDQLGVYGDLERTLEPIVTSSVLDAQSRALVDSVDGAKLLGIRMSYPLALVQRRTLLRSLERHLEPSTGQGRGRIIVGKRVQAFGQDQKTGVTAHCTDGSSYDGDIVVGANGVRSRIREEMWRASIDQGIGKINVSLERSAMRGEFKCLFGISKPVGGLEPGSTHDIWAKHITVAVYSGERDKLFWFLYGRLDRIYEGHEIPRYDAEDAARFAHDNLDMPLGRAAA